MRVPRAEDEREHNPVRGVIHNVHRIKPPLPRTPTPFYRHLFLRGRGALTITRIHLNLPPGGGPNLPLLTSIEMTPDASAVVTFHRIHWKGSPEYAAAQFASWLNLCLQNQITGGKIISSHTGPGTNRAAQALRWATQSLYRSPSSLAQHFRRMRARLGTPQATTATAHKLARIIYHLITHRVAYDDSILAAEERKDLQRFERRLRQQARALGYELVPEAA